LSTVNSKIYAEIEKYAELSLSSVYAKNNQPIKMFAEETWPNIILIELYTTNTILHI